MAAAEGRQRREVSWGNAELRAIYGIVGIVDPC